MPHLVTHLHLWVEGKGLSHEAIAQESVASYQPYGALSAHLQKQLGRQQESHRAFEQAVALCEDPAMGAPTTY